MKPSDVLHALEREAWEGVTTRRPGWCWRHRPGARGECVRTFEKDGTPYFRIDGAWGPDRRFQYKVVTLCGARPRQSFDKLYRAKAYAEALAMGETP